MSVFPEKQIDPDMYFELLGHIPDDVFIKAVNNVCTSVTEVNKSTNIIALINEFFINNNGLSSEEAWEIVISAIKKYGYLRIPEFEDDKIMRAINVNGGWKRLCASEEINWDKKRFIDTYKDFKESEAVKIRNGELLHKEKNQIEDQTVNRYLTDVTKKIGK